MAQTALVQPLSLLQLRNVFAIVQDKSPQPAQLLAVPSIVSHPGAEVQSANVGSEHWTVPAPASPPLSPGAEPSTPASVPDAPPALLPLAPDDPPASTPPSRDFNGSLIELHAVPPSTTSEKSANRPDRVTSLL